MTIGNRIKRLRESKSLSQVEFAKQVGIGKQLLYKYENNIITNIPSDKVKMIATALGTSPAYIMGWDNITSNSPVSIPVLGYVRAGIPIEAVEQILDYEEISSELASTGEFFALSIKGDSMEPKMSAGDVVIVRKQETVENGEIAVVLINGNDATIKKFYRTENGIKLIATNPAYDPFFYTPEEVDALPVRVIGKVVELRAKF